MSNIKYVDRKFRDESMVKIDTANKIIAAYMGQGLKLTLRQLYYQFVARHGLSNTEKSYKGLASLISDARLAGLVDWEAIEDRGRVPQTPSEWSSVLEIIEAACREYRKDRWHGQDCYVELWVEKQALAGVLEPLVSEYHVTLMVNKGYSSQSVLGRFGPPCPSFEGFRADCPGLADGVPGCPNLARVPRKCPGLHRCRTNRAGVRCGCVKILRYANLFRSTEIPAAFISLARSNSHRPLESGVQMTPWMSLGSSRLPSCNAQTLPRPSLPTK